MTSLYIEHIVQCHRNMFPLRNLFLTTRISLKYRCIFKKIGHIRPTYLGYSQKSWLWSKCIGKTTNYYRPLSISVDHTSFVAFTFQTGCSQHRFIGHKKSLVLLRHYFKVYCQEIGKNAWLSTKDAYLHTSKRNIGLVLFTSKQLKRWPPTWTSMTWR